MTYSSIINRYLDLIKSPNDGDRKYAIENIRSVVAEMELTIDNLKTIAEACPKIKCCQCSYFEKSEIDEEEYEPGFCSHWVRHVGDDEFCSRATTGSIPDNSW